MDKIQVELWPIDRPIPYARNPRKISAAAVDKVAASIKEFGFRQPIVVDREGVIIVGHTRLLAARKLGLDVVPVHVAENLTPAQARAYRLLDNRSHDETTWDEALLGPELLDLKGMELDLSLTGFDVREIDTAIAAATQREEVIDVAAPEPPKNPVSVAGDLWLLGRHRLLCGDSTSVVDVKRLCGSRRAVLVATDPPYAVSYKGGEHPGPKATKNERDKNWSDQYWDVIENAPQFFKLFIQTAINQAALPNAAWYIWHASARQSDLESAMRACGFQVHQQIIWFKSRAVLTYSHFMWQHEPCFYGWIKGKQPARRPPADARSVWQIESKIEDGVTGVHPTQKPIEIFARPIQYHTVPGDLIYEPFAGSGTAVVAAEQLGRTCCAMEISPAFVDVIIERWQKLTGKRATLDGDGRTFEEVAAARVPEVVAEADAADASVAPASESRFSLKRLARWVAQRGR